MKERERKRKKGRKKGRTPEGRNEGKKGRNEEMMEGMKGRTCERRKE